MRTLFAKILLWFWFTLAVSVIGSAFISAFIVNRNASDQQSPGARLVTFQLEEARLAYETGGRPGLQSFLENVQRIYGAQGILTERKGLASALGWRYSSMCPRTQVRATPPCHGTLTVTKTISA